MHKLLKIFKYYSKDLSKYISQKKIYIFNIKGNKNI